jgi:hypothetical protein
MPGAKGTNYAERGLLFSADFFTCAKQCLCINLISMKLRNTRKQER